LRTRPWTVTVDGEVKTAKTFAIEDILNWAPLEERIYRMRCVEGWSAVIPWAGFSFNELLKRVEPTGNAKFVEFWSLADPEQMPYVRAPFLDWPYIEAIRLDEARHPLTLFALGMYGEVMPKQNGAPLRLVVPWKYGFKGQSRFFASVSSRNNQKQCGPRQLQTNTASTPMGTPMFHQRWSQSHERRLGEFVKRKTLPVQWLRRAGCRALRRHGST
jgi:sulfoxide reductase catalytic subunit YedY